MSQQTRLQTAGDLANFIKASRGRNPAPETAAPAYPTPGNTAAIPLTLRALQKQTQGLGDDKQAPTDSSEYYVSRAAPVVGPTETLSQKDTTPSKPKAKTQPRGNAGAPTFSRASASLYQTDYGRPAKASPALPKRSGSAGVSTRRAGSAGSSRRGGQTARGSAHVQPTVVGSALRSTFSSGSAGGRKTSAAGGIVQSRGEGISSSAIAKATSCYR